MTQRVVVITGAASGLGRACAHRFGKDGSRLMLLDSNAAALGTFGSSPPESSFEFERRTVDIRTQVACRDSINAALGKYGQVDVLVNCAGVYPRVPVLEITEADWRLDLDVNLLGTYYMMVEAIKPMRERAQGRIVNVSSVDALVAHPGNAHYAASKAAVVSITRSVAAEVASMGIRVNAVAPGPMATEKAKQSEWYESHLASLPTGQSIEPDEVADLVYFLARPGNTSIIGENVLISGGYLIA